MNNLQQIEQQRSIRKAPARQVKKEFSVRDRIKPRGLWGLFEGRIHYDKNEDIFNLGI